MTREEAIEKIENLDNCYNQLSDDDKEALDMAIEALEQQPCDDAISRAETIKYLNINMAWYDEDGEIADSDEKLKAITDLINGVPSVTPQPKMGRWIADVDKWGDIVTTVNGYRCSECNAFNTDKDNFCSNCGAKMEEVTKEEEFDNLEGMLEDLWNATVEDLCNATESKDWYDIPYDIPSDEMTLEQARQAVKYLRKKLAKYLEQQSILDKIRAEIWDMQYGDEEKSMTDEDRADAYNNAIRQVIEVIDKHKAESEAIDADSN